MRLFLAAIAVILFYALLADCSGEGKNRGETDEKGKAAQSTDGEGEEASDEEKGAGDDEEPTADDSDADGDEKPLDDGGEESPLDRGEGEGASFDDGEEEGDIGENGGDRGSPDDDVEDGGEDSSQPCGSGENPCLPPRILVVEPTSGGASVDTPIKIYGENFQEGMECFLNGVPVENLRVASSTLAFGEAKSVSACDIGFRDVEALNPDGQSDTLPSGFVYYFDEDPVVFVHGYGTKLPEWENHWNTMKNYFKEICYPDEYLFAIRYADNTGSSIVHAFVELPPFIDNVLARTGAERVDIVAHSMGGLSTRLYIKEFGGDKKIRDYVSLAGAHHGTTVACADLLNEGAKEMCPPYADESKSHNKVQFILNGDPEMDDVDETPFGIEEGGMISYLSIYSDFDEIVIPQHSSCLNQKREGDCGDSVNVKVTEAIVGHAGIFLSREVFNMYISHLRARNRNKP
ncbi:MAG: hypothetical protein Kow0090_15330 [Myxococcota bacterium]